LTRLAACIDRGLQAVATEQEELRGQVQEIRKIAATVDPRRGPSRQRRRRFRRLQRRLKASPDRRRRQMAVVMAAFVVGLFAGGDLAGVPLDNLDLERWFRLPKGHERRIHGHRHAGVRLVQEGATLMPVLDAHRGREVPYTAAELLSYRDAEPPHVETQAIGRRKVMRRARSRKQRPCLLAELEKRYHDAP
jgi:hypothetical protein